eukprot:m.136687 g.136687  ORF g.136687 m.136687 type:complete len:382 (+) comp29871_c0_seq1:56-1201(+)
MDEPEPKKRGKIKERASWQYIKVDVHSVENHNVQPFFSCGAHLFPFFMFVTIVTTLVTLLVMYYRLDRQAYDICWSAYHDEEECTHDKTWIVPTISYTGQSDPEWMIFGVGLSLGAVLFAFSVYFVHRRAWAVALYKNVAAGRAGKLMTDPRVFCIPCCCCSSKEHHNGDNKSRFFAPCFCSPTSRPSLRALLKLTESLGYISSFFLFFVGWARMTWSWEIHNFVAFGFFGSGILYIPLFALAQHQIKKKCPAKFSNPWRYVFKITAVASLCIIAVAYAGVFFDLWLTCGAEWSTSYGRRIGFPVGEYLAAGFVGLFIFSHMEDIRVDVWYLKEQQKLQFQRAQNQLDEMANETSTDADYHSSFPEPMDEPIDVQPPISTF